MLRFSDVRRSFGSQLVIDGLSFTLPLTGVTFIMGPSGAGKSVLAQLAVGLLRPDSGTIELFDRRVDLLSERDLRVVRRDLAYVAQGPSLLDWMTLDENVAVALRQIVDTPPAEARLQARQALEHVGLAELAERYPHEVGPGVRKRAAVARALACRPRALCYDEPTTGLDPRSARQVDALIATAAREGTAALVVSHDLESVRGIGERVLVLHRGRLDFDGSVAAFQASHSAGVRALLERQPDG